MALTDNDIRSTVLFQRNGNDSLSIKQARELIVNDIKMIVAEVGAIVGSDVTGSGTQNFISKWNNLAGDSIGDSLIFDNGTSVGFGTTTFGANAVKILAIADGTAPTTNISGQSNVYSIAGQPNFKLSNGDVVKLFADSGWTAITGTASKAGYDTATATLQNVAQTLKAMQDHLVSLGLYKA